MRSSPVCETSHALDLAFERQPHGTFIVRWSSKPRSRTLEGHTMKIKEFLAEADVVIDQRAVDKFGLLQDLAGRAAAALKLPPDRVALEIAKRDELGSTGIGGGVSLPHARFREVKRPFGLLVRLKQPINFDAIDAEPVDIVFLLILPALSQLDQLNALAAAARKLRDREVLRRLRSAKSATELYQVARQWQRAPGNAGVRHAFGARPRASRRSELRRGHACRGCAEANGRQGAHRSCRIWRAGSEPTGRNCQPSGVGVARYGTAWLDSCPERGPSRC